MNSFLWNIQYFHFWNYLFWATFSSQAYLEFVDFLEKDKVNTILNMITMNQWNVENGIVIVNKMFIGTFYISIKQGNALYSISISFGDTLYMFNKIRKCVSNIWTYNSLLLRLVRLHLNCYSSLLSYTSCLQMKEHFLHCDSLNIIVIKY